MKMRKKRQTIKFNLRKQMNGTPPNFVSGAGGDEV
jgi:hypothetical protein